jgi:acetaldehyde dehydrogenase (acetylating)
MTSQREWPVAIIGSGNIGSDLMIKILRSDGPLSVGAIVGIDPASDGLARAARMGVPTTAEGVDGRRPLAPDHCMCPDAAVELHEIAIAVLSTRRRNANGAHRLGRMR